MKRTQWEEKHADDLFDGWCDSDVESLNEYIEMAWSEYLESLQEEQITLWENEQ